MVESPLGLWHAATMAVELLLGAPATSGAAVLILTGCIWWNGSPPPAQLRLVRLVPCMFIAVVGVVGGLIAGAATGMAIMFGPSLATGDFIGLPWLTMLPALALGAGTGLGVCAGVSLMGVYVMRRLARS